MIKGRSAACWALLLLGFTRTPMFPASFPQIPKNISTVRNESDVQVKFEYRNRDEWQQLAVDPHTDVSFVGDRVRIATERQDKATITVEIPIESGNKYIVFWNDPPGMWDFKGAS